MMLETLSEGVISELHVGLSGTMNQLFLKELANKPRRGLVGRVKAGFSGGGRCYGYDIVDTGPDGQRGVLRVNEAEAQVIHRIFRDYAGSASPRAIARALNAEGVPGPRGGECSGSTISGDRRAGDGILHQELVIGWRVFNKRTFRKHPDTGRRTSVLNPPETWIREPVPYLRIVDDELWAAAQARKGELSALPATYGANPKRLLSRTMVCGLCGSTMVLGGGKYACSRAREKGTCTNTKIIAATTVEARVLEGVRRHLLSPAAIKLAIKEAAERWWAEHRAALEQRAPIERELAEVERRLGRTQDLYVAGQIEMEEVKRRNAPLLVKRDELRARLAQADTPPPAKIRPFGPVALAYARTADQLHLALEGDDGAEMRAELRKLIECVVFTPLPGKGAFDLRVEGKLGQLLAVGEGWAACEVMLGAGTGFEPVTFRL